MNKLLWLMSAFVALAGPLMPAAADTSQDDSTIAAPAAAPVIDSATPSGLVRIADGLHILDNGTAASFYDAAHGVWLAGVITTPYKKFYVSCDIGAAAPLVANASGEFIGGFRLNAGELLLDKVPALQVYFPTDTIRAGLFKYSAVGAFVSRDWSAGDWRYGPYGGFEVKF